MNHLTEALRSNPCRWLTFPKLSGSAVGNESVDSSRYCCSSNVEDAREDSSVGINDSRRRRDFSRTRITEPTATTMTPMEAGAVCEGGVGKKGFGKGRRYEFR